jgi:hypothetical protein
MKKLVLLLLLTIIDVKFFQQDLQSCPTCVGNAAETALPFFKDECYHPRAFDSADFNTTSTHGLLQEEETR